MSWTPTAEQGRYMDLAMSLTTDCQMGRGTDTAECYANNLRRIADGIAPRPRLAPEHVEALRQMLIEASEEARRSALTEAGVIAARRAAAIRAALAALGEQP